MTHLFRPVTRHWITTCVWSVPLLAIYGAVLAPPRKRGDIELAVIGFLIFGGALIAAIVKLARTKIEVSDEGISGRIENETFKLRWAGVRAVWQTTDRNQPLLHIAARDDGITIPLKMFNSELLMELIYLHVPPEAIGEEAHKRLPSYQINRINSQKFVEQTDQPLRVKMWLATAVGVVCLVISGSLTLISFVAGLGWPTLILLFINGIGIYIILASGTIEMTREHIAFLRPFRRHQISWDEVNKIETDGGDGSLVFLGKDKCLACSGPSLWIGKDKDQMLRFFMAQIEWRELEIEQTPKARWRRSKNTRVND